MWSKTYSTQDQRQLEYNKCLEHDVFTDEDITGLTELRHKILTRKTKLCQYIKQERVWTTKESGLHFSA